MIKRMRSENVRRATSLPAALDKIIADGRRAHEVIVHIRALTRRQAPRKEQLWAAPNEPHGAVFRFSLPVAQETVS